MGGPSGGVAAPGPRRGLRGMERRRRCVVGRGHVAHAARAGDEPNRDDRPARSTSTSRRADRRSSSIDGVTRTVTWPENTFFSVKRDDRDLVVLRGIEPSYRWRSFCRAVLDVARETGCEMVVTLGALLADVPHTRNRARHGRFDRHRAGRSPRPRVVTVRGPDRDRRRAPRRLPRRSRSRRSRSGHPFPTISPLHRTRPRRSRCSSGSRLCASSTSTSAGSSARPLRGARRSTRSRPPTTTCSGYVADARGALRRRVRVRRLVGCEPPER